MLISDAILSSYFLDMDRSTVWHRRRQLHNRQWRFPAGFGVWLRGSSPSSWGARGPQHHPACQHDQAESPLRRLPRTQLRLWVRGGGDERDARDWRSDVQSHVRVRGRQYGSSQYARYVGYSHRECYLRVCMDSTRGKKGTIIAHRNCFISGLQTGCQTWNILVSGSYFYNSFHD